MHTFSEVSTFSQGGKNDDEKVDVEEIVKMKRRRREE